MYFDEVPLYTSTTGINQELAELVQYTDLVQKKISAEPHPRLSWKYKWMLRSSIQTEISGLIAFAVLAIQLERKDSILLY